MADKNFEVRKGITVANTVIVTSGSNTGFNNTAPVHTVSINGNMYVNTSLEINTSLIANTIGFYHTGLVNASSFTIGTVFTANTTRINIANTVGLQVNGSLGTAGQVLASNGTTVYWTTPTGGVTSVGSGNGLTGGAITTTGSLAVLPNTGIVANSTGVFVNATYIATLTSNNSSNFDGQPASYYTNATNIGSGTLNTDRLPATANISTAVNVGSNVSINTSMLFIGNSSVNAAINSSSFILNGAVLGAGGMKSIQSFTSSGTWTKPDGVTKILVFVTGGGGGGNPGLSDGDGTPGSGGGAGGTAIKFIDVTSVSSQTVTIGSGGAISSSGGNSIFGSFCTGTGGTTGNLGASGGVGGVGSNGDININGGYGIPPNNSYGTPGGTSFWGGGAGAYTASFANAQVYGAGGSGANYQGLYGSAGKSGVVLVLEF